jgi:hypothetical protein
MPPAAAVCKLGLEDIVSLTSVYRSGPSKAWLKIKNSKVSGSDALGRWDALCGMSICLLVRLASRASDNVFDWAQAIRTMATDSDHQKIAEQALAMLKTVYLREGPDAAVRSAKYMVEAAAIVIAEELGPAETRRFLHIVGVKQGQEH